MKLICVSVHSDDAAFSVGAALRAARADEKILVTLLSRSAWAWGRRGEEEATPTRMAEDRAFARWAGAVPRWLGVEDCSLAGRATADRRAAVGRALDEALEPQTGADTTVWLPLGISTHPDHQLVGEEVLRRAYSRRGAAQWWLYEDLPYAVRHPAGQGKHRLAAQGLTHLTVEWSCRPAELQSVLLAYRSQVNEQIAHDLATASERLHALPRPDGGVDLLGLIGRSNGRPLVTDR